MNKAEPIFRDKLVYPDGAILQMTLWRVPRSVPGSAHLFKYSLFYGTHGQRIVGYDNEAGKGDHRHYGNIQESYAFTTWETLLQDFLADVRRVRGEE